MAHLPDKRSLRAGFNKAVPLALGLVSSFASTVLLARIVGAADFGIFSYSLAWVTGAGLLAKAGHDSAILRLLPLLERSERWAEARSLVLQTFAVVGRNASLASLIVLPFALMFANRFPGGTAMPMIIGLPMIFLVGISSIRRSVLLSRGAMWLSEIPENILRPLIFVVFVWLISSAATASRLMLLSDAVYFLSVAVAFAVIRVIDIRDFRSPVLTGYDFSEAGSIARALRGINVLAIILKNADVVIVGAISDAVNTGIYVAATRLAIIASTPLAVLDPIASSEVSLLHSRGDKHGLIRTARAYAFMSTLFSGSAFAVFLLFGEHVMALYGPAFARGHYLVAILSLGGLFASITGPSGIFLSMTGHHRLSFKISAYTTAIYLIALAGLTWKYSIMGAAIAYVIGEVVKNIAQVVAVWSAEHINVTLLPFFGKDAQ